MCLFKNSLGFYFFMVELTTLSRLDYRDASLAKFYRIVLGIILKIKTNVDYLILTWLKWIYGLYSNYYRVATLSKL